VSRIQEVAEVQAGGRQVCKVWQAGRQCRGKPGRCRQNADRKAGRTEVVKTWQNQTAEGTAIQAGKSRQAEIQQAGSRIPRGMN